FAAVEIGGHFGHLVVYKAECERLGSIILLVVAEADRFERKERLAGFANQADVVFVAAGRCIATAELAGASNSDIVGIGSNNRLVVRVNVADKAAVAVVL